MDVSLSPSPHVHFAVEKVIGVSGDGNFQVQWAPSWVSKFHLVGCEHLIQEFLLRQSEKSVIRECGTETASRVNELDNDTLHADEHCTDASNFQRPVEDNLSEDDNFTQVMGNYNESADAWQCADGGYGSEKQPPTSSDNIEESIAYTGGDETSLVTMADMTNYEENDDNFPFETFDINIRVKEEQEEDVVVVYPSDTSNSSAKQKNLSKTLTSPSLISPTSEYTKSPSSNRTITSPLSLDAEIDKSPTISNMTVVSNSQSYQNNESPQSPDFYTTSPPQLPLDMRKPHLCVYCGKSYSLKHHLTRHIRSHTGEKPYKCSLCDKAFTRNNVLKEHLRTHEERPTYKCDVCQSTFKQKNALKKHKLTTHM